jgi:hypothetical protein
MPAVYALKVRKSDLGLLTMLNDGLVPPPLTFKQDVYLVFKVDKSGKNVTTTFMTKREMYQTYDISGWSPLMLRLKKV